MSFEELLRLQQRIGDLSGSLINRHAFDLVHVSHPDPKSPESAFLRATSWLYCFYFEAGRISLTFLRRLGIVYAVINRQECEDHVEIVRSLRTELHHNLGYSNSDLAARTKAANWRRIACKTAVPIQAEDWEHCYDKIIKEATSYLGHIDEILRCIEADSAGAPDKVEEWIRLLERDLPAHRFDPLIDEAKYRLGRDSTNTVSFRNRYCDRWRKQLEILDDGYNFDYEATRLIEKTLLDEEGRVLPITGQDIMELLQIPPGPRVGKLLLLARERFDSAPCGKESLLEFIKSNSQS